MTEFFITAYAMIAMFVIMSMQRNRREQRQSSQMMTMVGWGLFSLSSTLAVLMTGLALALAFGVQMALPAALDAPLF
jgi:multisubunit Na+/H+ antiporter MnhB subunit